MRTRDQHSLPSARMLLKNHSRYNDCLQSAILTIVHTCFGIIFEPPGCSGSHLLTSSTMPSITSSRSPAALAATTSSNRYSLIRAKNAPTTHQHLKLVLIWQTNETRKRRLSSPQTMPQYDLPVFCAHLSANGWHPRTSAAAAISSTWLMSKSYLAT